jgi:PKD repeat protein
MKTITQTVSPFRRNLILGLFFLFSFTLSSYRCVACNAYFTYTDTINGHYSFTSTSTGVDWATQYYWNPGDGSGWQSGGTIFNYTYTANGTYNAKLYIYSDSSTCNDSITIPITVTNVGATPCNLSASFTSSVGANGVVTFTSTSTGTNANTLYFWAAGDSNERVQGTSTYTHTYLYQYTYGVGLIVEDTGSAYCLDSVFEGVNVSTADSSYCHLHGNFTYTLGSNGQVTFNSIISGADSATHYYWSMGDTSGYFYGTYDTSIVYTYAYNGTYNVTLYITSDTLALITCVDTITIPITITNACNMNANFTYQYDSAGQMQFTSTSAGTTGSTTYHWTFGDGTSVNGYDTATHRYSFIGYYNVTLTIANPGGCTDSSTQAIYIYNKDSLQADFVYSEDTLSTGTYYFTSTSLGTDGYTYYKWTPGDGTPSDSGLEMSTYQHTYLSNGPYSATLTIWYTVLPHGALHTSSPRYDESSYTTTVNVTTVTGIQSVVDNKTYDIYPNPNNGSFKIAVTGLTNEKNAVIRITNMMGQVIYQSTATVNNGNSLSDINLQNAANGIYLLQIISQGNTYTSRIAIQR